MVTQFYSPTIGGQERVVEDLSAELIRLGHHVAIAALQQGGLPPVSEVAGVRVYRMESTAARFFHGYIDPERPHAPPAVDPKAAAELRRVLELEQPDIVHGHDWLIHSLLPLKRRHGPGLVVTLHDHSLVCANKRLIRAGEACAGPGPAKCLRCSASHYGFAKGPVIAVGNWSMSAAERRLVDLFLPVSQVVADAARLRPDRYRVIPNFLSDPADEPAGEHKLPGLPRRFILFAGDVSADKGVRVLLEAHRLLEDAPPLVLIGRVVEPEILTPAVGPERASRLQVLAAPIGNVRAVGAQPHAVVLDAFSRCTVAVVPSLMHEAFGLVALEAMRAGRPVIASNIGGLRDIVRDPKSGILVPPGDVEALHAALREVLSDSALRRRLRTAAKRRAADFTADRIVPQVEQAYEDVLTARRAAANHQEPAARSHLGSFPSNAAATSKQIWHRLHRREPRVILALTVLCLAGTAIPAGTWSAVRAILVAPLVLFLPGYAVTGAIFRRQAPRWVERTALALSLSLVTTGLISLLLYVMSFELTLRSWAISLALITVTATIIRAARPTTPDRSTVASSGPALRLPPRPAQIAMILLAICLIAAAVALARTPLPSPSAPGYTALWLTRDPRSAALIVGVRSEEHQRAHYVLRLRLPGRTTSRKLTLSPGQTWQETLPPARRATASLKRAGQAGVYRFVRLSPTHTTSP